MGDLSGCVLVDTNCKQVLSMRILQLVIKDSYLAHEHLKLPKGRISKNMSWSGPGYWYKDWCFRRWKDFSTFFVGPSLLIRADTSRKQRTRPVYFVTLQPKTSSAFRYGLPDWTMEESYVRIELAVLL